MDISQGEIVLVDYGYSNQQGSKVRPALVVSKTQYNRRFEDVLLAPLTSSKFSSYEYYVEIRDKHVNGNLEQTSFVKTDTLNSIQQDLIHKSVGELNQKKFEKISSKIKKLVDPE